MLRSLLQPITKQHTARKVISYPPEHLLQIIIDVDQYSQFLPFCTHSKILKRWEGGFEATTSIEVPLFSKATYRSHVLVKPDKLRVDISSLESTVFEKLESHWQLRSINEGQGCDATLFMKIVSSDPIVGAALGQFVEKITSMQMQAYEKRCRVVPLRRAVS